MRDDKRQTVKIELLSQWKLEADFRNDIDTWVQGSKSQPPEPDPAEVCRFEGSCRLSGILRRKLKVKLANGFILH